MADVLTPEQRHKCMSSIRRKNTLPEVLLRAILHKSGLRYRLHDNKLPGSPDIVFRQFRAVLFVHGCYWHFHGCYKSTIPKSRSCFWKKKFQDNRIRDQRNIQSLLQIGWRVMVVWGCALTGREAYSSSLILNKVNNWLHSSESLSQLPDLTHQPVLGEQNRMQHNKKVLLKARFQRLADIGIIGRYAIPAYSGEYER